MNSRSNEKLIIFIAGLLFRLFLVVYIILTNPYGLEFFNNPNYQGADQGDFAKIAVNIVDHRSFSFSDQAPYQPDRFRTPIFPYFMAFSYWLTGGFFLLTILNILISSAIGPIVYEIARQLFNDNRKLSFLSGLVFALLPYGAYLSAMAMADNVFAFFFVLAIFFTIVFFQKQQWKNLALSVFFLALATLTRPISQYVIVIIMASLFLLKIDFRKKIISIVLMAVLFILTLSPWLIRNYFVFQKIQLSSLGGYHIFVSWLGPYRASIKDHISRNEEADRLQQYIKEKYGKERHEAMYDSVISAELGKETKKEILQNLRTYLPFHLMSGVIYFMNNDVILTLNEVFKINSGNIYIIERLVSRDWYGFLKNLSQLNYFYILVYFLSYFLIFSKNILALWGIKKYFRSSAVLTFFMVALMIYFPLLVGPEGHARFRYPIEPFLIILAASTIFKNNLKSQKL